ncbi:MAG: YcgN family cysteine cluster protein [Xanthobacteraceae bacterium]
MSAADPPFWKTKSLGQMTAAEWESLCDGCGRCCLQKLQDADTDETFYTSVGCRLLDTHACRCTDYENRSAKVKDCVRLTPRNINRIAWLPPTCGYKLAAAGRDLYWWHPLVSGDAETVHAAGISVRGRVRKSEDEVPDAELEDYIVKWPQRGARAKGAKRRA